MPSRTDRRAFSLVELLVVIAIIAILVGLTLPALRAARESARKAKCQSDLRQMLTAVNAYTVDFRDFLPLPNWGPAAQQPGWLYDETVGPAVGRSFIAEDKRTGTLYPYVETDAAYRCPSHTPPFAGTAEMTSYIMNGAVVAYRSPNRSFRIDQFDSGDVIMWDANEQGSSAFNDGASFPSEITPGHHGDCINGASMDGATVYLPGPEFQRELLARPGRLWCNPTTRSGD